ncbi:hypothetical protein QPK87_13285 [Kamptonema cortianum]|uniref:Secreted protein n=1 Tax=Geitlerinema calcuttense NRMC-F 0142 TaxID=2922238 RepID=A0ABT7LYS5_9CYAN|nr:hypothetical protein [Geitlerinema calcuttense]MDK3157542.1 hypothetical protein [Kamptonema cortianum]MDL5056954.1 hypothetical protein [Geitlerinema calcuttense NRMC-F 0142]
MKTFQFSIIISIAVLFSMHLHANDTTLGILEKQAFTELDEFKKNPTYEGFVKLRDTTHKLRITLNHNAPLEDKIALYHTLINIGNEFENIKENIIYKEFKESGKYDRIMKGIGFEKNPEDAIDPYIRYNFNANDHQILYDNINLTNKNITFYKYLTNRLYKIMLSNTNQITHGIKIAIDSSYSDIITEKNTITDPISSNTNTVSPIEKTTDTAKPLMDQRSSESSPILILGLTKRNWISVLMIAGGSALVVMVLLYAFRPKGK